MPETRTFEHAALVKRAKAGDVGAFEQLYKASVGPVFGLCMRMVSDQARAEELTQDAFVRAWQKLHTFRGDSLFSSWLHRLTVNLVLSDRRKRSRREDREQGIDPTMPSLRSSLGSSGIELERAIASLPPRARDVFVLYEVYGYRHEEVGALLGITAGGCKSQLSRARRLMRKALGEVQDAT